MSKAARTASLGSLSVKWLKKDFPFRRRAVAQLVYSSGFSENMAHEMLDALFSALTVSKLWALLCSELGDPAVLEGFVKEPRAGRQRRARGPRAILHVFPSNMPSAAVTSLVLGLLVKSRNILKVSSRNAGILPLYLESLKKHDKELWNSCKLIRSHAEAKHAAKSADLVVAYGSDESLEDIRKSVPAKTPFVGYGHRVSFGLILRESLKGAEAKRLARRTAYDVWMADQRGCLSPVLLFAQQGGKVGPKDFARLVAVELERLEKNERSKPKRGMADGLAGGRLRDVFRIRALKGERIGYWISDTPGLWMVGYDERKEAEFSSGAQILRVKGFGKLSDLEGALQKMSGSLQAASLECASTHRKNLAEWLGLFGVNRVCHAGELQKPPVTWHHDGRLNLAGWLAWTDLE